MRLRLAVAGLLLGLSSLVTLPFIATGDVTASSPIVTVVAPPPPLCTDGTPEDPHYYFFDKEKESKGSFGPSADKGSDAAVKAELVRRLCGDEKTGQDPVLVGVIGRLYLHTVPDAAFHSVSPDFPRDMANELVNYDIDWDQSRVVTTTVPEGATTLLMYAGDNPWPTVGTTPLRHRQSRFLEIYFYGSDQPTLLRLPCGFQPVFTDAHKAAMIAD